MEAEAKKEVEAAEKATAEVQKVRMEYLDTLFRFAKTIWIHAYLFQSTYSPGNRRGRKEGMWQNIKSGTKIVWDL